jgi:acetylornithine deacetylase/succinyl-diaminopimelate desuccinylase-like protein
MVSDPWLAAQPPGFHLAGRRAARLSGAHVPIWVTTFDGCLARASTGATFSHAGTPTIGFGPGAIAAAHAVDEFIPLDELVRGAQVLAVVAMRFCGVEPD